MDPWKIQPDEQMRYEQQFAQLNPSDGFITGQQSREFFFKSNLPPPILAKIWELSDINRDGKLDKREFGIAMHLIRKKLQGMEIPPALPPSMLTPTGNTAQPAAAWGALPDVLPKVASIPASALGSVPGNAPGQFGQAGAFNPPVMGTLPHTGSFGSAMGGFNQLQPDGQRSRTGSTAPLHERPASAGPGMVPTGEWAVPHATKLKYNKIFHDMDKMRSGSLNGNQARTVLMQSGLPHPALAQIWALADIDKDGKLTSEEFVLAMHLAEMARQREPIPTALPPELIPPSFRRPRGVSSSAVPIPAMAAASDASVAGSASDDIMGFNTPVSFEDKRKENFDKGQAELERRRQALQEMQRQEQEERERREREEFERRERIRLEQERKRQAELEAQMARQREIEERQEEERRKILEQREAARKEMERQRKIERQRHRRHELLNERTRVYEELAHFKTENTGIDLPGVDAETKRKDLLQLVEETRNQVRERKDVIDGMRMTRDRLLEEITRFTNEEASLTDQSNRARLERQEAERIAAHLPGGNNDSTASLHLGIQQKKDAAAELSARVSESQSSISNLNQQVDEKNGRIRTMQDRFQTLYEEHVRLLHDFQNKQTSLIQNTQETATVVKSDNSASAWEKPQNLYPDLHSMQSYDEGNQQTANVVSDAWAENGFGHDTGFGTADNGFEHTDDVWGESPFGDQSGVSETHVADLKEKLEEKLKIRSPSIKHEHHLSFDNDFRKTKFRKYRALYAYTAGNEDELSFQPGDVIYVPETHDGEPGWLPGELNGRTGWLPENHVEFLGEVDEIPKDNRKVEKPVPKSRGNSIQSDSPALDNAQALSGNHKARAIHNWNAKKDNHLTFAKGEILLLKQKAENWYLGEKENGGSNGWFPAACVEILPDEKGTAQHQNLVGELKKTLQSHSSLEGNKPVAESQYIALYQYQSDVEGDLNFMAGEIIQVVQKDGDWWTGKVGNRIGIFPSNYVKEQSAPAIPSQDSLGKAMSQSQSEESTKRKPEVYIAVAPFTAAGPEQISFAKNDMILVKKKTETGWWEGELQAKGKQRQTGWFPAAYVKTVGSGSDSGATTPSHDKGKAPPIPKAEPASSGGLSGTKVKALYDYAAMNPDELTFKKDDIIIIVSKEDDNWWKGKLGGREGILPSNYVQVIG
ncbi:intersectin-2-like [Paramacrobiotus metropolitanus]|uniref:intersectin-2-like n=1 Tax=Paramacrobiotus metropolitanus TaxID=2943436 RepID=UPI00244646D9|nr:intersectin-2-like [Paramacrobiotus metropolitanus]XP_055329503.1 intersectin-2-like [Paramacrobiotus metropolitanus]XP_055329504.1 intersectin-2-like [Paramacrobiotus metropolitanus]XP_055329505.1 intersectin-2-like [Paramacrobiotus metropolitanus]